LPFVATKDLLPVQIVIVIKNERICSGGVRKSGFMKLTKLYMDSMGSGCRLLPVKSLQKPGLPDAT